MSEFRVLKALDTWEAVLGVLPAQDLAGERRGRAGN